MQVLVRQQRIEVKAIRSRSPTGLSIDGEGKLDDTSAQTRV